MRAGHSPCWLRRRGFLASFTAWRRLRTSWRGACPLALRCPPRSASRGRSNKRPARHLTDRLEVPPWAGSADTLRWVNSLLSPCKRGRAGRAWRELVWLSDQFAPVPPGGAPGMPAPLSLAALPARVYSGRTPRSRGAGPGPLAGSGALKKGCSCGRAGRPVREDPATAVLLPPAQERNSPILSTCDILPVCDSLHGSACKPTGTKKDCCWTGESVPAFCLCYSSSGSSIGTWACP
jgi:hypothetical protein